MKKKEGKPITKANKSTLATTKKKARVLSKKKEGKPDITQVQGELVSDTNITSDAKLNPKQMMFVMERCTDYNATRAYKEVYKCSHRVANINGTRLLVQDSIQEAIGNYMKSKLEKLGLGAERALRNLQSVVNKCLQLEPITQIIRYEKISTITDEDGNEATIRDTQYREEQIKGPFQPASAIAGIEKITNLLKTDDPKDKEIKALTDKQKEAILALGNTYKPPQAE